MIHQGSSGFEGSPADIEIHAREILSIRRRMIEIVANHTGHPVEQIRDDIDRDRFMTSEEAKVYGVIDQVIEPRGLRPLRPLAGLSRDQGSANGRSRGDPQR
jgi:ATP-dependent Clp protease protease subunit